MFLDIVILSYRLLVIEPSKCCLRMDSYTILRCLYPLANNIGHILSIMVGPYNVLLDLVPQVRYPLEEQVYGRQIVTTTL